MANQDPQPEIYTVRANFNADNAATPTAGATINANTTQVVSIYTNQANNEEVRQSNRLEQNVANTWVRENSFHQHLACNDGSKHKCQTCYLR